jgi:RNA polymerase sigma-70 factor, ECF subfamily
VDVQLEPAPNGEPSSDDFGAWAGPSVLAMTRLARRLAPQADPDDIVQNALTRAWQKRAQFDPDRGIPTTWLLAITADQARAARRAHERRLRIVDDDAELPDAGSPDRLADLDLERAICTLGERQQLAVHLHYFLGLTVDETAAVMNCAAGTVKSTLFDARARLRAVLGDDDD